MAVYQKCDGIWKPFGRIFHHYGRQEVGQHDGQAGHIQS